MIKRLNMQSRVFQFLRPTQDLEQQMDKIITAANVARVAVLTGVMVFYSLTNPNVLLPNALLDDTLFGSEGHLINRSFWFYVWLSVYGGIILLSFIYPNLQKQQRFAIPNVASVIDIGMMVWLMHILGGVMSGLGMLILPFLAIACLLSYGRFWGLYATFSTICILAMTIWHYYLFKGQYGFLHLMSRAGILVVSFYSVAAVTSFAAAYIGRVGETASKHLSDYERISALNKVVLNRMDDAIIVIDKKSLIWHFNRQAVQYFPSLKQKQPMPFVRDIIRQWTNHPKHSFETNMMMNNEDMSVRAMPILQGSDELLILFIRAEKEIQAAAQSVKLASLGLLTANLAHEIRNPLSAMRQANGLLTENADDPMTHKLTNIIDKNIERIDKMIEEVSFLNKSDRINKEVIRLSDFWKNFRQEFILTRPEAEGHLQANIAFGIEVVFDPMHLQQILWNLCNNAWRHCSKSKSDSIRILAQPVSAYQVSICVYDDGAGVPNDIVKHIFEPFFTTQSQAQGTGLGLYVARELAHANKGDLRYLTSKRAFEIILPRAEPL